MLLIAGIWLWVAGNRRIRNGGRYTMKCHGLSSVPFPSVTGRTMEGGGGARWHTPWVTC